MKKQLAIEMGKQTLISVIIFTVLFLVLAFLECVAPHLKNELLKWHDPSFIVGIPASVIGVAYVLTIKNPQNYMGFYLGIIMSLLLAWQFYLQGQYDLVVLYILVFIPFLLSSLFSWRKATLSTDKKAAAFSPAFLNTKGMLITQLIGILIIFGDFALVSYLQGAAPSMEVVWIRLMAALLISSSFFANFYLIYKKNDAWICWVIYSIAGMVLNAIVGNLFSFMLFTVFLLVNGSATIAWIRGTNMEDFGWVGEPDRMKRIATRRLHILQRKEKWLCMRIERNREQQIDLASRFNLND